MDTPVCVQTQRAVIVRPRAFAMVSLIVAAAATGVSAAPFTSRANLKTAVRNCLSADPTGACDCSQPSVNCGAAGSSSMDQWDTSLVTDMSELFLGYWDFNHDISSWNTSQVTDMSNMFQYAQSFNWDTLGWDVSSVTDMSHMFDGAFSFSGHSYALSSWNTGQVRNMNSMFKEAHSFVGIGIDQWDVSQVTDMSRMFQGAQSFATNILNWKTRDGVDAYNMFREAPAWSANYFNRNQGSTDGPPNTWSLHGTHGYNGSDDNSPTAAIIAGILCTVALLAILALIYYWEDIRRITQSCVRGGIDEVAQVQTHAKVRMAVGRKTVRAHSRRRQSKRADAIRTRDVESGNQSASEGSDAPKKTALPPNRREHRIPIRAPVTPARFASTVTLPGQRNAAPSPVVVVLQSPQAQAQAQTPNQPTPNASATIDAKE